MHSKNIKAVLLLSDGTVFQGKSCGKVGTTTGEIAFNTGMTGYQEIFTDPSYYGQILTMANSHIGNYGANKLEIESDQNQIKGLVVKKFAHHFSRYGDDNQMLQTFLEKDNVVGIKDVDTRELIGHIRENGAQNAIISSEDKSIDELKELLSKAPDMIGLELASKVSTKEIYDSGNGTHKIALIDFGVKKNIIRCLTERNCSVKVFPYNVTIDEIKAFSPDGIMLSNGPGDPEPLKDSVQVVSELVKEDYPIFGICLGHQVLAISQGLGTEKMHNGHRGINHPVKNLLTNRCEVTSQNHGFVVKRNDVENHTGITLTHEHLNDHTVAGISIKGKKAFSVQYHPESSPGPNDSRYLFDQFIDVVAKNKLKTVKS
jgi:carbamoyl-phosphate synthase small subunit